MFTAITRPVSNFQIASILAGINNISTKTESAASTIGFWEFPNEAELADELLAALSNPLPAMSSPEIAPEDFERFAQGFLS